MPPHWLRRLRRTSNIWRYYFRASQTDQIFAILPSFTLKKTRSLLTGLRWHYQRGDFEDAMKAGVLIVSVWWDGGTYTPLELILALLSILRSSDMHWLLAKFKSSALKQRKRIVLPYILRLSKVDEKWKWTQFIQPKTHLCGIKSYQHFIFSFWLPKLLVVSISCDMRCCIWNNLSLQRKSALRVTVTESFRLIFKKFDNLLKSNMSR